MTPETSEILTPWLAIWREEGLVRVLIGAIVGGLWVAGWTALRARTEPRRAAAAIVTGSAFVVAGALAWRHASVVDDAFIALRFARRWLEGHGLVFNVGEYVEGYTDLLWVLIVAAISGLTGAELPLVALVASGVAMLGNLVATVAIARTVDRRAVWLPIAPWLLALHPVFLRHGTTGLETGFGVLLVQLGVLLQLRSVYVASGALFGLAALTRPDLALFGGVAVLVTAIESRRSAALLVAPLAAILALVTGWRLGYYGDFVPNTFWAKGEGGHWGQGALYLLDFWLGSQAWALALVAAGWAAFALRGPRDARWRLAAFLVVAVPLQVVYVGRMGGDFMSGRFFLCLLPFLAIAAEDALHQVAERRVGAAVAVGALLFATARPTPTIDDGRIVARIADEGGVYRVIDISPIEIRHRSWKTGHFVKRTLTDRGIRPVIAVGTIGMIGYYSDLPLIDMHGLTDRHVARMPLADRGYPGHEKWADDAYLRRRGVTLVMSNRRCTSPRHSEITKVQTTPSHGRPWCLMTWDPVVMAQIKARAPEWRIPDFEAWLDDYVSGLDALPEKEIARELRWLDAFYFDAHDDPRRAPIAAAAGR